MINNWSPLQNLANALRICLEKIFMASGNIDVMATREKLIVKPRALIDYGEVTTLLMFSYCRVDRLEPQIPRDLGNGRHLILRTAKCLAKRLGTALTNLFADL